eukprot:2592623-Amphidinium_carterae.1
MKQHAWSWPCANVVTCWQGVSMDWHPDWTGWEVIDAIFLLVYIIELTLKYFLLGWRQFTTPPLLWRSP